MKRRAILALIALSSIAPSLGLAETHFSKNLPASKDNTAYQEGDLSDGKGIFIFTGMNANGDVPPPDARRAFLAFAIADSIPPGAVIDSVRLTLYLSRTPLTGTYITKLHRVTADWGEGASNADFQEGSGIAAQPNDVTWLYRFFTTVLWTTPGGDYVAGASAQIPVGTVAFYTWSSAQMAADVQSWLDTPANNFGWVIIGDESKGATAERFNSRENATVARRPKLTVFYTLAPVAAKPVTWGAVKALYR